MDTYEAWEARRREAEAWVPRRVQALGLPPVRRADAELAGGLWADLVEAYEALTVHRLDGIRLLDAGDDLAYELIDFEIQLQHVVWHYEALVRFLTLIDLYPDDLGPRWQMGNIPKTWSTRFHRALRKAKGSLPHWRRLRSQAAE